MEGVSVPNFARGLNILLVDHDTISLMYLGSLLEQYSFQVTTTELASLALSMICEQENRFKLVISNMNMPDMDGLSFLPTLLKKGIPFILMSSERDVNAAGRALAEGACYFLEKPILLEDLKHVWQHVYRKRGNPLKESLKASNEGKVNINISKDSQGSKTEESGSTGVLHGIGRQHMTMDPKGKSKELEVEEVGLVGKTHVRESENTCIEWHKQGRSVLKRANDDHGGDQSKPQEKRSKFSSEQIDFVLMRAIEEGRKDDNKSSGDKKSRFLWGPELHLKFTAALSALGDKNARPKKILKMMNVPNLTLRQVASHLQKYKAQVQRINETGATNLPSVSKPSSTPCGRTEFAKSLQKQSFLPSRLGYESSNFETGGNTTQFPPNFLPNGEWYADHFFSHELRTPNQYFGYMGSSGNSHSYLSINNNEVQTETYGDFQRLNQIRETNGFQHDLNQPLIEYADMLKVLEDDPEELYAFGSEPNPGDVDRYCEWLRETLCENVTFPEQFEL